MNTRTICAFPVFLGLCGVFATPAFALNFTLGEVEGQLDSVLSIGSSWSTQSREQELLASSGDDGRRNFDKGDAFSTVFKGIHDLDLRYHDSGVLVRGRYWYDFELADGDHPFKEISDDGRANMAQSSGFQLLDAFFYHNYQVGDLGGTVRVGRQVINWGESTFIRGGINGMNPVDISALRQPGAEIKEGLLPANTFFISQALTDSFTLDAFYQFEWQKTVVDNCGTFFAANDFVADGCGGATVGPVLDQNAIAQAALSPFGVNLTSEGVEIKRMRDKEPRDSGQFGVAGRWYVGSLDAEIGAYFANYHSKQPYVSSRFSPNVEDTAFVPQLCANVGLAGPACGALMGSQLGPALVAAYRMGTAGYYIDYPEDIRLYGLSFSTALDIGTSLAGEISYRPNMPIQLNSVDQTIAAVGIPANTPLLSSGEYTATNNGFFNGYQRKEVTQAQMTAIHMFDRVMGADRFTLIAEAGATYVGGLEGKGGLRYGRANTFGQGELYPDNSLCGGPHCNDEGFVTDFSAGYRMRGVWDYSSLIAGVELRPSVTWSHDVYGYAPSPGFEEGARAIALGVDATYLNQYGAGISYTNFFGGKYNTAVDRDFLSLSFSVSF
ncbi:DUF1302 domain-containing protein [Halopseudomonas sabulinigri]|uniref:DUF1302 domain-containing protein n=1 Tax=Halopseudomonas sabulinigri TaxID=472181 RepID=A0ABP9ZTC0_9GAMM